MRDGAAIKIGTSQTAVSTVAIGEVYADACQWEGTLLDRSAISSTYEVGAALATQKGLRVSTPTDVTVDGFAGTYMERRVPARADLSGCDEFQFRVYLDGRGPNGGQRYLVAGELQQLWILDVDGVPLVIDASLDPGTSARDRAELIQMWSPSRSILGREGEQVARSSHPRARREGGDPTHGQARAIGPSEGRKR